MKINKSRLRLLIFVLIPILMVWILYNGETEYEKLPVLGETDITGEKIPYVIRDFRLVDQMGDTITREDLDDKIYVANFFFATCPDVCPKMNSYLHEVYEKFKEFDDVVFVSHTVDPYNDSVAVLKEYSDKFDVKPKKWFFLTGRKAEIYDLATHSYKLVATKGSEPQDFIHADELVLVDKQHRIRGVFEGLEYQEVRHLMDAIKVLRREYKDLNNK